MWVYVILTVVVLSPIWLFILMCSGILIADGVWEAGLPEMAAEFEGRPLSHWVRQADDLDPQRRGEAVDMLGRMLDYDAPHWMNCGGGYVSTRDVRVVYQHRIEKDAKTLLPDVLRILQRDCGPTSSREDRLSALRGIAALPYLRKVDAEAVNMKRSFLPSIEDALQGAADDPELLAAALRCLGSLRYIGNRISLPEEVVPLILAALEHEPVQLFVIRELHLFPSSTEPQLLDRLREFAANARAENNFEREIEIINRINQVESASDDNAKRRQDMFNWH